jgi:hypothetical protein
VSSGSSALAFTIVRPSHVVSFEFGLAVAGWGRDYMSCRSGAGSEASARSLSDGSRCGIRPFFAGRLACTTGFGNTGVLLYACSSGCRCDRSSFRDRGSLPSSPASLGSADGVAFVFLSTGDCAPVAWCALAIIPSVLSSPRTSHSAQSQAAVARRIATRRARRLSRPRPSSRVAASPYLRLSWSGLGGRRARLRRPCPRTG